MVADHFVAFAVCDDGQIVVAREERYLDKGSGRLIRITAIECGGGYELPCNGRAEGGRGAASIATAPIPVPLDRRRPTTRRAPTMLCLTAARLASSNLPREWPARDWSINAKKRRLVRNPGLDLFGRDTPGTVESSGGGQRIGFRRPQPGPRRFDLTQGVWANAMIAGDASIWTWMLGMPE